MMEVLTLKIGLLDKQNLYDFDINRSWKGKLTL